MNSVSTMNRGENDAVFLFKLTHMKYPCTVFAQEYDYRHGYSLDCYRNFL